MNGRHNNLFPEITYMPKKVLIALPPAMLAEADYVAEQEHRTRSDLIREALRRYIAFFKRDHSKPATSIDSDVA